MQTHPTAGDDAGAFEAIAVSFDLAADTIGDVLAGGELDDNSRETLAELTRTLHTAAAGIAAAATVRRSTVRGSAGLEGWNHVGAFWAIWRHLPCRARNAITDAGFMWLDELDELSDRQLRSHHDIGTVTISKLRRLLDRYYWRAGEPAASESLWHSIADQLTQCLKNPSNTDRDRQRLEQGLNFADRVLAEHGAPLVDPAAARKAVI